jgi:amino-acid N-acetyltransferase
MNDDPIAGHVELIREVFLYATRFQGGTFVIQIDDGPLEHPLLPRLLKDLVLLKEAGIRFCLIPGAKSRIDELLTQYGIPWTTHHGVRVASQEAMPFVKIAAFDGASKLMTDLAELDTTAVIGNWVRARGIGVLDGVDFQQTGMVERVEEELIHKTLEEGFVPIFPPVGWSLAGRPYSISSRELAATVAIALKAQKLFFVTVGTRTLPKAFRVPEGVEQDADGRVSRMTVQEAEEFLTLNRELREEHPYELISLAHRAGRNGIERTHIVDAEIEGVILKEIFSNAGVGTMIHANVYQSIRRMSQEDIPDVLRIMQLWIARGVLRKRSEDELLNRSEDYVVYETDGSIRGCGALHIYPGHLGEVAGLAVDPHFARQGIGRRVVTYLMQRARELRIGRVFVLTTRTTDWFEGLGFVPGTPEDLPEERRSDYDEKRKSRVLIHDVEPAAELTR